MLNFPRSLVRAALALFGAACLHAAATPGQPPAAPVRDYAVSDATGEILPKYKALVDLTPPNYDAAVAVLDAQLAKVAADSYDAALLYQLKTQTMLQKGDFSKAIEPMERTLNLSDSKTPTYFDDRVTTGLVFLLAQLYFQEAIQSKNPTLVQAYYEKADKFFTRWLKITPKSNADAQLVYSQLLYTWGVQNPDHANLDLINRALVQIEAGLHLATRPKDTLYVLKLVCLQLLNRNSEAAEVLELIVKQKPESGTYWQQLAAFYLSSGQDLRAILAIERAQSHGHMNSPKDHYNLVGIYFNIGRFEKAADLLEAGLANGQIDNDMKNWELLALTYQQLQRPYKSIEALKQATKVFPKSGQLEFMIAQAYHTLEKPQDAFEHLQAAVAKGELNKPPQVYLFLAYIAFELKKFDVAMEAAVKASENPEGSKDGQNMVRAIKDIMAEREARKNKT